MSHQSINAHFSDFENFIMERKQSDSKIEFKVPARGELMYLEYSTRLKLINPTRVFGCYHFPFSI